ncbi:MAG TPA: transposase [Gammaproteobacteria bacterium]|nr:transposase [Gammaproteobacteria bacterium]
MILLSEVIDTFESQLQEQYGDRLLPGHQRALSAMWHCRTELSPMMKVKCPACEASALLPHSCGHRSCPHCQHYQSQCWLERQQQKLLPVDYFMITFTLPAQLRSLAWSHQRLVYDLLFKLSWETLESFGLRDKKLKGQVGATAVLHTHSRKLDYHPHVHMIVPAGALDKTSRLWRKKDGKYLFKQDNLAKVYRAKWLQALKENDLTVNARLPEKWVVDCQHVGAGKQAIIYLGKYLYRGVLSEHNILSIKDGKVTFRYMENSGISKTRTLPGADFLWLLLQHVLPRGFRRSRDYGFLHGNSKKLIQLLQLLFHVAVPIIRKTARAGIVCPHCGAEMMIVATRIMPKHRAMASP